MKKYSAYTLKEVKELYEIGLRAENHDIIYDILEEKGFTCTDAHKIANRGFEDKDAPREIVIKTYYRIGEPIVCPYSGEYKPSYNYADDRPELGVSVATEEWMNSIKSLFFDISKGVYKIEGIEIASGGDDEPLIYPTDFAQKTKIRTRAGLRKAIERANK